MASGARFLNDQTAWAVGGGGTIFQSSDNGQSWTKDKVADNLPSNLYKARPGAPR